MSREEDVAVAESQGWLGPVKWADDEEGHDPYMFPPTPVGFAAAITNDRDWDCIVPRFVDAAAGRG